MSDSAKGSGARPRTRISTPARVLAGLLVFGVLSGCAIVLFAAAFVGGSLLGDPSDAGSAASRARGLAWATRSGTQLVTGTALALAVAAGASAAAAWRRSRLWLAAGTLCSLILAGTLVAAAVTVVQNVDAAARVAAEPRGDVLGSATLPGVASPTTGLPAPPELTATRAEVERLGELARSVSPPPGSDPLAAAGAPSWNEDACALQGTGAPGRAVTLALELPSDPAGDRVAEIRRLWAEAGYPTVPQRVSVWSTELPESALGTVALVPRSPVQLASVHDRFTVDGALGIRITGACARGE